jgi:hypothetical protein
MRMRIEITSSIISLNSPFPRFLFLASLPGCCFGSSFVFFSIEPAEIHKKREKLKRKMKRKR